MGRVLTLKHGTGLGGELLKRGIREIRDQMKPKRIIIEAQTYAIGFYEREGFRICSDEFPEDGIPHVRMLLECESRQEKRETGYVSGIGKAFCTDSSDRRRKGHDGPGLQKSDFQ